jgi:hypothetical protein
MSAIAIRPWYWRDRRELGDCRDVARGPDPGDGGPHVAVDHDPALVRLNARGLEVQPVVRHAPRGEYDLGGANLVPGRAVARGDRGHDVAVTANALTKTEVVISSPSSSSAAARVAEASASEFSEIRLERVDDVTSDPKRRKTGRSSSPTAPAPTTSSDSGSSVRSSGRDVVDPADVVDPLDRRHRGARAGCNQDPLCLEHELADSDSVLVEERCFARVGGEALGHQLGDPLVLRFLQGFLPRAHSREIHVGGAGLDPDPGRQLVHVVGELRGHQVCLGRGAGDVRAAPAPALALDQRHAGPVVAGRLVRRVPCGRAAA